MKKQGERRKGEEGRSLTRTFNAAMIKPVSCLEDDNECMVYVCCIVAWARPLQIFVGFHHWRKQIAIHIKVLKQSIPNLYHRTCKSVSKENQLPLLQEHYHYTLRDTKNEQR